MLRFRQDSVDLTQVSGDLAEGFQVLARDLLTPANPGLASFAARGKDGGIDLWADGPTRTVAECKVVGDDSVAAVLARWRETAGHLDTHLAHPSGPTPGQAQYAPWYRTDRPITRYLFCTTARLSNLAQVDQVRDEIRSFFQGLAKRPHLAHLVGITVDVFDWNALSTGLTARQRMHWFHSERPGGLMPFGQSGPVRGFRAWLEEGRLPFLERSVFLARHPAPAGSDIPTEADLLDRLESDTTYGMVVSGPGGAGKTRLTIELARRAVTRGWIVLRVTRRLAAGALDGLARRLGESDRVLLLLDYAETQADLGELVLALADLCDAQGLHLRYLASCRTSFVDALPLVEFEHVPLDPPGDAGAWHEAYRRETVRHILEHSGVGSTSLQLDACRDVPVLAVFMAWLASQGRQADLAELLREADFGAWVHKRIALSFPGDGRRIGKELAQLAGLYPLPIDAARQLDVARHQPLHARFVDDGWVEKDADPITGDESWLAVHDVLADRVVLRWVERHHHQAQELVDDVLATAARIGVLDSALAALQRVGASPALAGVDWSRAFATSLQRDGRAWRQHRTLLLRTSLLTPPERVGLLMQSGWEGSEADPDWCNAVGWLARWASSNGTAELGAEERKALADAAVVAARAGLSSNFALTQALRIQPERLRDEALTWLTGHGLEFQAHYLLVGWLRAGPGVRPVRDATRAWIVHHQGVWHFTFVARAWSDAGGEAAVLEPGLQPWLVRFGREQEGQFVYKAWLDAGGERERVAEHIDSWLVVHGDNESAQFVYTAWLDAGGDRDRVAEHIDSWLALHDDNESASFVYKAWLDAGGDRDRVAGHIENWLAVHANHDRASFVYQAWMAAGGEFAAMRDAALVFLHARRDDPYLNHALKYIASQPDLSPEAVEDILHWCTVHADNPESLWGLSRAWRHMDRPEHAKAALQATEQVLTRWLDDGTDQPLAVQFGVVSVFTLLAGNVGIRNATDTLRLTRLVAAWLRSSNPLPDGARPISQAGSAHLAWHVRHALHHGYLDADLDRAVLIRFMQWADIVGTPPQT